MRRAVQEYETKEPRRPDLATRATNFTSTASPSSAPIAAGRLSTTSRRFGEWNLIQSQLGAHTASAIQASEQCSPYSTIGSPVTGQAPFLWTYCPPGRRNAVVLTNTSPRPQESEESTGPVRVVGGSSPYDVIFVEESQPSSSTSSSSYEDQAEKRREQDFLDKISDEYREILMRKGDDAQDRRKAFRYDIL